MNEKKSNSIQYKISTMTMSTKIPNCQLNLLNIGKYLQVDDEIIGIKYNHANLNVMKGEYSTTIYKKSKNKVIDKINKTLFYNQISIIVKVNNHNINAKLFGNGSLHLTGCRSIDDGVIVTQCIYKKLKNLENHKTSTLLTKDMNSVLLDKDNLIYSYQNFQIIGHKENDKYIIFKKEYNIDQNTNMFISTKEEIQRKRNIINFDGKSIGYAKIELIKHHNKLYKKNGNLYYDWNNKLIFYNDSNIIGRIIYTLENENITNLSKYEDVFEIEYNTNPFLGYCNENKENENKENDNVQNNKKNIDDLLKLDDTETYESFKKLIDISIHCINACFSLNYKINRQKFYENLLNLNFISKYRPESYSGIKLIYKIQDFNDDNNENTKGECEKYIGKYDGKCYCTCKCICTNITFLIFQSGNVIVTGFKNLKQIDNVLISFDNIWNGFLKNVIV